MNPLIILHGALGSASQLNPVGTLLEKEGYSVHQLNFSGHGGNAFEATFGIEQFAEDVLQYLDNNNLQQVDIMGYSMGGYVALWLAYDHPERVGTILTLGTKFDWSVESAEKEIRKLNAKKIIEKIPPFARLLEQRHAPNDWKILLQKTSDMMMGLGRQPLLTREILETIENPVTVCLGDQDDMADRNFSEQVATWLPHGRFHLVEHTPHPIEKVDFRKIVPLLP